MPPDLLDISLSLTTRLNEHDTRISLLEAFRAEAKITRERHDQLLDKLIVQDQELITSLQAISGKFDSLIAQISTGFKTAVICATIITTLISGFWIYNSQQDAKFRDIQQQYSQQHDQDMRK